MYDKIGNYCEIISGYAFKAKDLNEQDGIPVIKIGNISNKNNIIQENMQFTELSFEKIDNKFQINKGDILISLTGSHINQPNSMVGKCCRNYNGQVYLLNQRAGKVIPKENADKDFLYYLLSSDAIKYAIANRAYGGANQVNVSPKDIMNIKFDIPPLKIQKRISLVLNNYDFLIQNNCKKILLLEQMAEEIYKEWFIRFRFPEHKNYNFVEAKPYGWIYGNKSIMLIPKEWHFGKLNEIGKFVRGKNITSAEMQEGEIPVISAGIEPSGYHNESNVKGKSLTMSASGANAGYLKYNLDDIWAADCSYYQNEDNIWFVYSSLKFIESAIKNLQVGSAQPHVYAKNINKLNIIIPEEKYIKMYNDFVNPMFEEIKKLNEKNKILIQQRDLLLPRLMSGKLEVK